MQPAGHGPELQAGELAGLVERGQRLAVQARRARGHGEQREAGVARGRDQDQVSRVAVEDEALLAVEDPAVVAVGGGEPDRRGLPGTVVLGERQRAHGLAGGDAWQQVAPGRLVGAGQQGRGRQHRAGQVRAAVERGTQFLQHDGLVGEGETAAAVLLGDRDARQAKLRTGLPPHVPVDPVVGVHELAHPRHRRPVGQEPPHRRAQFPLFLADG